MDAPHGSGPADAADAAAEADTTSPLSRQLRLDESMLSALPGESDKKFLSSLSVRKKRRDRRRLEAMLNATFATAGATAAAAGSTVDGRAGDVPAAGTSAAAAAAAASAAAAAAPLLAEPSPSALEEGGAAEEAEAAAAAAPPPAEFGSPEAEAQQEAAELVQDQMDALPSMVAHMEGRRMERQNLQYRMRTIAARVPARQRARQSVRKLWSSCTDLLASAFDVLTLGLYRASFGKIEGNFGAGCASYFSFIRWLFVFNLALSCVLFASFALPYLVTGAGLDFEATVPAELVSGEPAAVLAFPEMAEAVRCSRLARRQLANLSNPGDVWGSITDLVTGGGWMLTLPVFIGSYFNKSVAVLNANATDGDGDSGGSSSSLTYREYYNTPVAMLLCLIVLIGSGVFAALSTSNSLYRKILKVSVRGSRRAKLSAELFTAWDCGLRAEKAARLRQRTVAMRLRSLVLHLQLKARSRSPATLAARALAHLATVGLYAAAAYLIYYTTAIQGRLNRRRRLSPTVRLLVDLMPQLTISLINVLVPVVLSKLIAFEYYSASVEILVQLARVVFLKLLSFVTLIVTIGVVLTCPEHERDSCGSCQAIDTLCWETYVGQQLYRTLVIDVLICLVVTPSLDLTRWALSVKVGGVCAKVPQPELLISNEVLGLVYRQSICFVGAFFCPCLLPIACLSYGCLFQIKRFTLRFMSVSNKSFRASRLERFFLDVLLLFLFVLLVPLTICVLNFDPSRGCGPFRVHQWSTGYHMANTITNWVMWSDSDIAKSVYTYTVLNPTTHLLTLLLLLVLTYFFYSVVRARDTLIGFLEKKLQSESKIKLELANRELQLLKMRQ